MAEQTVVPAVKLSGKVTVPGEVETAEKALLLAVLSRGEGRVGNVPPTIGLLSDLLRRLGADIRSHCGAVCVIGKGMQGLRPTGEPLDLAALQGDTAVLLVAVLAAQSFQTRLRLGGHRPACEPLLPSLAAMGAFIDYVDDETLAVGGGEQIHGVVHQDGDLPFAVKLALLLVGLEADGRTLLREQPSDRDGIANWLRERKVTVERARGVDGEYSVAVSGGQTLAPLVVEVPGFLPLAYPFVVAALGLHGSELRLPRLSLCSETRGFLDLTRQLGASIEFTEARDGVTDVVVRGSSIKSGRIAGLRAAKVGPHLPLVAVLATRAMGQVVLRDVEYGQSDERDCRAHLVTQLRAIGARVGEYPEGLVIDGGSQLNGATVETNGKVELVQAFAVAGVWSGGSMIIRHSEAVDSVHPGFFATLASVCQPHKPVSASDS